MNPDGVSYLDIASETLRAGPLALVNSYWSPLYPALIAFWEWVCRPSSFQEFAYIHALNAILYAGAAISFAYFLRELIRLRFAAGRDAARDSIFIAFGFAVFFRFMNMDVNAFVVTPDLLVATAAFLSAGLFLRVLRGRSDSIAFVALGAAIAAGYLAKSAMLPAGAALLCILLLWSPRSKSHRHGVLIAAGVALILCAPLILLVSKRLGRPSISETGRLNYLWFVDGLPVFQGWTGTLGGDMPEHGPRIVAEDPKIIEFASPIPGTYPLWYDPAYWYAGAKARIDLMRQLHVIRNTLGFYRDMFADLRLLMEGLVVLLIFTYVRRKRPGRADLLLLLWPVAVLSMYALVWTEPRFIAPFMVISWLTAYNAVFAQAREERILLAVLAVVMLASSVRQTFLAERKVLLPGPSYASPYTYVWMPVPPNISPDQIAARKLMAAGIKTGDAIATVGPAFADFYARIARVHVVAEVVEIDKFWRLQPEAAAALERKLAGTGAKALIAKNKPKGFQAGVWEDVPGTIYSMLLLRD
jgi:hypothetical protein